MIKSWWRRCFPVVYFPLPSAANPGRRMLQDPLWLSVLQRAWLVIRCCFHTIWIYYHLSKMVLTLFHTANAPINGHNLIEYWSWQEIHKVPQLNNFQGWNAVKLVPQFQNHPDGGQLSDVSQTVFLSPPFYQKTSLPVVLCTTPPWTGSMRSRASHHLTTSTPLSWLSLLFNITWTLKKISEDCVQQF